MATTTRYTTTFDHQIDVVWSMNRDFNNDPAYIEGITESEIENGKRGDEVVAIRRFNYGAIGSGKASRPSRTWSIASPMQASSHLSTRKKMARNGPLLPIIREQSGSGRQTVPR